MLRKFVCAAVVLAVGISVAVAEEMNGFITKVDGNKITFKKGFKEETKELTLADNVKVKNATTKKVEDKVEVIVGEDLKDGLKNERFTKNRFGVGVFSQIITNDDGKVTEIRVFPKAKGKGKPFRKEPNPLTSVLLKLVCFFLPDFWPGNM